MKLSKLFGILATILLLGGIITTAVPILSAYKIQVSVGFPYSSSSCCSAVFPVKVSNSGILSLNDVKISIEATDKSGAILASSTAPTTTIPSGETTTIDVTLTYSNESNPSNAFLLRVGASANLGGFMPVQTSFLLNFGSSGLPPPTAKTPIQHVVIIMMENHAFDNIFGVYPTDNKSTSNPIISQIQVPVNLLGDQNLPQGITAIPNGTYSTPDIPHTTAAEIAAWDQGMMDKFSTSIGPNSLRYFTSSQLPIEWDWAEQYGLADNYFQPVPGPTLSNRLVALTGEPPTGSNASFFSYVASNLFTELNYYNVSWGYYDQGGASAIAQYLNLGGLETHMGDVSNFTTDLQAGSLPSVSWIDPFVWTNETSGVGIQYSQHPPYSVAVGENWLLGIVNSIMNSKYWNNTAIFITYDESGGYYDQVAPPTLYGTQLGFRVPLIVISPYAKEGYVSGTLLTHTSLDAFVDYNWGMAALSNLVLNSNLPLDFFNFNQTYTDGSIVRAPLTLSTTTSFPVAPQVPFSSLPYDRHGSSDVTLASLGFSTWPGGL